MKLDRRFLAVLACVAVVIACSARPGPEHREEEDHHDEADRVVLSAEAYETAGITIGSVGLRALTPTIQVTGTLSYDERAMAIATARIGGRITRVVADYGEIVSSGDDRVPHRRSLVPVH